MAHGLADQSFHSYKEAKKWIDSWIASKDMYFFRRRIHILPKRWEKVVWAGKDLIFAKKQRELIQGPNSKMNNR